MTFKQLEALLWIVRLGGFSQAARQLHMTQSALSKRIQELESAVGAPVFDRTQRAARLTHMGEEVYAVAGELLQHRDAAIEKLRCAEIPVTRARLGVTELTAMTWLPRLVQAMNRELPSIGIDPCVQSTAALCEMVGENSIDLAIVPIDQSRPSLVAEPIGRVRNAWFCRPGLVDTSRLMPVEHLASHRLLTQGSQSGTGRAYGEWMKTVGLRPADYIASDNLIALIGMTVSGLGVSYLPEACVRPLVEARQLDMIRTRPRLPDIEYGVVYRKEGSKAWLHSIVKLARQCCDFSRTFQSAYASDISRSSR